jgi:hypothetical protein
VLPIFALTLFLSAFLLFLVEPMVAKMVLPLLGGTPAVWNTCIVFFQAALLAGYAYAHWTPARLGARRHLPIHFAILLAPAVVLPLSIAGWIPPATENPVPWLLALLTVCVGLPFFALATSAPLLQNWFSQSSHKAARDPYFLYAASNLGSMVALLSYPTLVEPNFPLADQRLFWSLGYAIFLVLTAGCALLLLRSSTTEVHAPTSEVKNDPDPNYIDPYSAAVISGTADPVSSPDPEPWTRNPHPSPVQRIRWVLLAAIPSSLMLGVTTFITTDVAPVPLIWVIPLALYLLSFILVFSRLWPNILHQAMVLYLPVMILVLLAVPYFNFHLRIGQLIALHLLAFFVTAMVCHGELARSRPAPRYLTEYYLWISVGGTVGGLLNALVAPQLFHWVIEYPLIIALPCLLRPFLVPARRPVDDAVSGDNQADPAFDEKPSGFRRFLLPRLPRYAQSMAWIAFGLTAAIAFFALYGYLATTEHIERNFFGTLAVWRQDSFRCFSHGRILHGRQNLDPERRSLPTSYYHPTGPIGQVFTALKSDPTRKNFALVGLGIGAITAYARAGQKWTFYEINPAVERIARNPDYFTYLDDSVERGADLKVVLGDARLQLNKAGERYDLILVDAFSSDSIPIHLITREAFQVYLRRLADNGILAVHFSNWYLDLAPVLEELARDAGLTFLVQADEKLTDQEKEEGKDESDWAIMAREPQALARFSTDPRWKHYTGKPQSRLWTDDYSNLLRVFMWR